MISENGNAATNLVVVESITTRLLLLPPMQLIYL